MRKWHVYIIIILVELSGYRICRIPIWKWHKLFTNVLLWLLSVDAKKTVFVNHKRHIITCIFVFCIWIIRRFVNVLIKECSKLIQIYRAPIYYIFSRQISITFVFRRHIFKNYCEDKLKHRLTNFYQIFLIYFLFLLILLL